MQSDEYLDNVKLGGDTSLRALLPSKAGFNQHEIGSSQTALLAMTV